MHACPHCGYRFEDAESLHRHLEEGEGCPEIYGTTLDTHTLLNRGCEVEDVPLRKGRL